MAMLTHKNDVVDDHKSQTAEDDEEGDGQDDQGIVIVMGKVGERSLHAKNVETGIAVGRYGKEDGDPNTLQAVLWDEADPQQNSAHRLEGQRHNADQPEELGDICQIAV